MPRHTIQEYCNLRPQECCSPDSLFYLTESNNPTDECWYKRQPCSWYEQAWKLHEGNVQSSWDWRQERPRKIMATRLIQDNGSTSASGATDWSQKLEEFGQLRNCIY